MKLHLKLLFILLACSGNLLSQTARIDSLNKQISPLLYSNPNKADSLLQIATDLSIKLNYRKGIAQCTHFYGIQAFVRDDFERAEKFFGDAEKRFLDLNDTLAANNAAFSNAMIFRSYGMYELASTSFDKVKKVYERYNDHHGIVRCIINLGIGHYDQGNFTEALGVFAVALEQGIKYNCVDANMYGNIANCYIRLENYDSALVYNRHAYEFEKEQGGGIDLIHWGGGLGLLCYNMGFTDEGLILLEEAKDIAEEHHIWGELAIVLNNLAILYAEQKEFEIAFEYQVEYIRLRDSLEADQFKLKLNESEAVLANEKSKSQIAIMEAQEEASEIRNQRERLFSRGMIAMVVLILIIAVLLFIQSKKHKKHNRILDAKNQRIELQHKEITDSITYAKRIQNAILPPQRLMADSFADFFVLYLPKDVVAGDFYWFERSGSKILFAVGDCTGHGVPGAMVSVICNSGLNRSVREYGLTEPAEILNKTREIVIREFEKSEEVVRDGMDIALCLLDQYQLKFSGAHNPLWLLRHGTEKIEEIRGDKQPIGTHVEQSPFTAHALAVEKGDQIYLFSDGLADQFGGPDGKKFKTLNLRKLLLSVRQLPMSIQKEELMNTFKTWKGNFEQIDDVCVVGIRV